MCWWWFITVLSPSLFVLLINGFSFGRVNNILQIKFKTDKFPLERIQNIFEKRIDLEKKVQVKGKIITRAQRRTENFSVRSKVWASLCEETIVGVDLLVCSPLQSPLSYCMATALSLLPLLSLTPLLCLTIISGPCV